MLHLLEKLGAISHSVEDTVPIGIIVPCLLISFGFITGPVMGWVEGITTREH